MIINYISLISLIVMLLCSAITKSIMDTISFTFASSKLKNLGKWWNPAISWKNKWKNGDPTQGERFFGSSTFFVSLTNAWHFFQHFFLLPLFLIPIAYSQIFPIVNWKFWMVTDFLFIYLFFTLCFQVSYWILNKK
jgi:hypothetical protein